MTDVMSTPDESLRRALIARLSSGNPAEEAELLVADLLRHGSRVAAGIVSLLDELEDVSRKVLSAAVTGLSELRRRELLAVALPWLDLGIAMAGASGATALKYLQESPISLALLATDADRERVLQQALELAERDANIALEWVRQAAGLLSAVPSAEIPHWVEIGLEVASLDYVVGVEFFRQSASIAEIVPAADVRAWIAFGMKLIRPNSLGKTDYVGTLEFFRSSPRILSTIPSPLIRKQVIAFGSVLADRDPAIAIRFLADSAVILDRLPSDDWRTRVLTYGMLVADRDADAASQYIRHASDVVLQAGEAASSAFDLWYRGGMDILEFSIEGGRAYFAMETRNALAAVEEVAHRVRLPEVARTLKLFAEGLCGYDILIRALPDAGNGTVAQARPVVAADRRTFSLPAAVTRYADREQNLRWYLAMVTHEAGHLQFGTYDTNFQLLHDVVEDVRSRYVDPDHIGTLADLFQAYPQPALIRDLWTILEDARVEHRLQLEYPGLAKSLAELAREAVTTRSLTHGMTVKEMVVDCLLLLTTSEPATVRIPDVLEPIMTRAWDLVRPVLSANATSEDSIRAAHRIYQLLDAMVGRVETPPEGSAANEPESSTTTGPAASERVGSYRPVTNWTYRGEMNAEMVKDRSRQTGEEIGATSAGVVSAGVTEPTGVSTETLMEERARHEVDELVPKSVPTPAPAGQQGLDHTEQVDEPSRQEGAVFVYDEWDGAIRDYRSRWCRVIERTTAEADPDFVDATLRARAGSIRLLRRYFEALRPSGLRRMFAQIDGEELDLDATIRRVVDQAAGRDGSDRVYIRREYRDRSVAVAFVIDLSGSTSRRIEPEHRRIIDVEKEALILLSEALEAIGDQYAIYGYSSQGRHAVDFHVLKDFDERVARSAPRIGAVQPLQQNRDGAAIRHAVRKLREREARIRLLVLISDGRPLDDGYTDEYALEDTKRALQEARHAGVHPFCITVDQATEPYVKRMYGDVSYMVIDRIAALPERLPRFYQWLTA